MSELTEAQQRRLGQAQRHNAILDRISGMGSVAVSEMAELLGVSEATIRRDLDHLATRRLVERTHGGALAHEGIPAPSRGRRRVLAQQKAAARILAQQCEGARAIAVTGAVLGDLLGEQLAGRDVTVLTNAIDVAAKLTTSPQVELVVTGGYRSSRTPVLTGGLAESAVIGFRVDTAVVIADAVSSSGVSLTSADAARVAAAMVSRATRVIAGCPPEGLGDDRFGRVCAISDVAAIVTWSPGVSGSGPDPSVLRGLRGLGVEVIVAEKSQGEPDAS